MTDYEPVTDALRVAGVDPTDFSLFVNRPHPELGIHRDVFDSRTAYHVLMEWLPRVTDRGVKDTIARRLAETGKRTETAQALIQEYRVADDETVQWVLGDSIARVMTPADHADVVELAAGGGLGAQMLFYALWRIKTDASREVVLQGISDPDVCNHAMYALRRLDGNEEARRRIEPLLEHESEDVRRIAAKTLRRIDKALAR